MAGAGQASDTNFWALLCRTQATKNLNPSQTASFFFLGLGEERRTPRAIPRPLDDGFTRYFRRHHLYSLALPDTKRVGRRLILFRDRRPIVARAVIDQRVDNFQRESTNSAACSRVNKQYKKKQTFFPLFSIAVAREYLQPISFLNSLETCLLYTSPSPRDKRQSRMPSSA